MLLGFSPFRCYQPHLRSINTRPQVDFTCRRVSCMLYHVDSPLPHVAPSFLPSIVIGLKTTRQRVACTCCSSFVGVAALWVFLQLFYFPCNFVVFSCYPICIQVGLNGILKVMPLSTSLLRGLDRVEVSCDGYVLICALFNCLYWWPVFLVFVSRLHHSFDAFSFLFLLIMFVFGLIVRLPNHFLLFLVVILLRYSC